MIGGILATWGGVIQSIGHSAGHSVSLSVTWASSMVRSAMAACVSWWLEVMRASDASRRSASNTKDALPRVCDNNKSSN